MIHFVIALLQLQHESFECSPAGFTVNPSFPNLEASPDGAVMCECCGAGLLEVKCPYKHRNWHPHDLTDGKYCLHEVAGVVELKKTHDYYLQIQGQMAVCRRDYSDFVCWTPKDMHLERIALDESVFSTIKPALDHFFQSVVLPELLTHSLYDGEGNKEEESPVLKLQPTYCLCGEGEHGQMIACDDPRCPREWFHYKCVGITREPKGKWYCPDCVKHL